MNLCFGTKFTLIVVIKILTINLPSQPFLGSHLGFHIFLHHGLFRGRTFFIAWLFLIRYHFSLYLYTPKLAIGWLLGFLNLSFFFTTGRIKRQSRFQGRIQELARGGAQTGQVVDDWESQILLLVAAFLKQQIITS